MLIIFQCIWPFGYQELVFLQRIFDDCKKPYPIKEDNSMSMELSSYTPCMTRGQNGSKELTNTRNTKYLSKSLFNDKHNRIFSKNEFNSKELTNSNKLSLWKSFKPESNGVIEEDNNNMKENNTNINIFKALPKITNIQRTSIDLTKILPSATNSYDSDKLQKHSQSFSHITSEIDIVEKPNALFDITSCEDLNLNTSDEKENRQIEEGKTQTNVTTNQLKTNVNSTTEALPKFTDVIDSNTVMNSTLDYSTLSTLDNDLNIDAILEDILTTEDSANIVGGTDDWLQLLSV